MQADASINTLILPRSLPFISLAQNTLNVLGKGTSQSNKTVFVELRIRNNASSVL